MLEQNQSAAIQNINGLVGTIGSIFDTVVYLLIGLAIVYIVFNIVQYVVKGADPAGKAKALGGAAYGIIGLAIILSIWGLVGILLDTFDTGDNVPSKSLPSANFIGGSSSSGGQSGSVRSPGTGNSGSVTSP